MDLYRGGLDVVLFFIIRRVGIVEITVSILNLFVSKGKRTYWGYLMFSMLKIV